MFENNTGTHITVTKYLLVGILLTVSILALGWGVWSYTYQQNLQEPPVTATTTESGARYTAEEWEAIRQAEIGSSTPRYTEEEWDAVREGATESTSSQPYTAEEWEAIRSGR